MKVQRSSTFNIAHPDHLGSNVFSPIVSGVKGLAKAIFSVGRGAHSSVRSPDPLLAKLSVSTSFSKTLKQTFQANHLVAQRQENRQLAVSSLHQAIARALGNNDLALERIKQAALEIATQEVGNATPPRAASPQLVKYINKLSNKALNWAKKNEHLSATVKQVVAEYKEAYSPQIGHLSWEVLKRLPSMQADILKEKAIVDLKAQYGDLVNTLVHHELEHTYLFKTRDKTELSVSGTQQINHQELESKLFDLEQQIEEQINGHLRVVLDNPSALHEFINGDGLHNALFAHFEEIQSQEPWVRLPHAVSNLLQAKVEECFTSGPMKEVEKLEQAITGQVKKWHVELFHSGVKNIVDRVKTEKALELYAHFQKNNRVAFTFPNLLTHLITNALKMPLPYRFEYQPNPNGRSVSQFSGAYFKANKKTESPVLSTTRVMSADGTTYELLNRLTEKDSHALLQQQGLKQHGKVVLGSGTFGKVRLARNLRNGQIVAVKKSKIEGNSNSAEDLNEEIEKLKVLQEKAHRLTSAEKNTLVGMLDFAQVTQPSRFVQNTSVDKSYLFLPLSNAGDGTGAVNQLAALRYEGKQQEADQRFLHLATGYSRAVMNLHSLGFHHRDMKPANFLHSWVKAPQSAQGQAGGWVEQVKLADFGTMQFAEDKSAKDSMIDGTYVYCPPEKFAYPEGKGLGSNPLYHAEKHDVFSLGVSLLELKHGPLKSHFPMNSAPVPPQRVLNLKRLDGIVAQIHVPLVLQGTYERGDDRIGAAWRSSGIPTEQLQNLDMTHPDNIIAKLLATDQKERLTAAQAFEYFSRAHS